MSLQPEWLPAIGALAFLEVQEGNGAAALNRIDALKQTRPNNPQLLALEGEVYTVLQKYSEASQSCKRPRRSALRRSSQPSSSRCELPVSCQTPSSLWSVGRASIRKICRSAPCSPMRISRVARPAKAIEQYEQIVQRQPKHVPSLNNLAWLYHEHRDSRALATARQAHQLAPKVPAIMDTLGWILVDSGNTAEGLPLLEQAVASAQASADIKYHYAAALARTGAKARAKAAAHPVARRSGDLRQPRRSPTPVAGVGWAGVASVTDKRALRHGFKGYSGGFGSFSVRLPPL